MAPHNDGQRRRKNTLVNKELIAAAELRDLSRLVRTIEVNLPQMNLVNVVTALHRLAKVVEGDDAAHATLLKLPMVQGLLAAARSELLPMGGFCANPSSQSLSNILWSAAVLGLEDIALFQACAALTVTYMMEFKPMELSTLIWACAKLDGQARDGASASLRWSGPVFDAAVDYIISYADGFTFRNLATTVGAFARVGKPNPRVFEAVATQMQRVVHTAKRQELAKTAWAYGTASYHHEELFMALAAHALPMINSFQAKELSNLLWGFAANEIFHAELFAKASNCAQRADLNAQGLANVLWALTRLRPKHPITCHTVRSLLPRCVQLLTTFKPQEIASTAVSVAKSLLHEGEDAKRSNAPVPDEAMDFLNKAMPIALMRVHEFSGQSLANLATAYAVVQSDTSMGFVATIGLHVHQRVEQLETTVLLQLIRAYCADIRTGKAKAPFCEVYKNVSCALFKVVAHRVHRCKAEERGSLGRLLKLVFRLQGDDDLCLEDLERYCTLLARGENLNDRTDENAGLNTPDSSEEESHVINQRRTLSLATVVSDDVGSYYGAATPTSPTPRSVHPTSRSGLRLKNRAITQQTPSECVRAQASTRLTSESLLDDRSELTSETDRSVMIGGAPLTINDLQAFRKDYQELRAVPALDYRHDGNTEDALSKTMKQNRRQERIEALGPPLDILSRNMELDALQAYRADYQELRAIPALDFVPKRVSPSNWLLQDIVDPSLKSVEPESLGPPLPIFAAVLEEHDHSSSGQPEDMVPVLSKARLKRTQDTRVFSQFGGKATAACREEASSQASSSEWSSSRCRPVTVGPLAIEFDDLQAFRKDYQELRAVPGLDFQPEVRCDSVISSSSVPMLPKSMKQHRREVDDLGGLGPPLDFVSANADFQTIQTFRTNYQNLRACPALDFIPTHVHPSSWLTEDTTSDESVHLAKAAYNVKPGNLGPPLELFTQQWLSESHSQRSDDRSSLQGSSI